MGGIGQAVGQFIAQLFAEMGRHEALEQAKRHPRIVKIVFLFLAGILLLALVAS